MVFPPSSDRMKYLFASLFSVLLVFTISFFGTLVVDVIGSSSYGEIVELVGYVALFLAYLLAIFGPAFHIALKEGWNAFLWTLVAELVWLVLFITFSAGLFYVVALPARHQYQPVYHPGFVEPNPSCKGRDCQVPFKTPSFDSSSPLF